QQAPAFAGTRGVTPRSDDKGRPWAGTPAHAPCKTPHPLPIIRRLRDLGIFLPSLGRGLPADVAGSSSGSWKSGGADGRAATTAAALQLRAAGKRALALFAAHVANHVVV